MKKNDVELNGASILVTGSPGFIGAHVVRRLLKEMNGGCVVSFDNLNDYYDPALKRWRLALIEEAARASGAEHVFVQGDLCDRPLLEQLFETYHFSVVLHLAAQAGVRASITGPEAYIRSNIIGFYHLLEVLRAHPAAHFVFASSSSVYGNRPEAAIPAEGEAAADTDGAQGVPFRVTDKADEPVSLYAATKRSDELLAYAYASLYGQPTTALRFFTVYGPAGRPDMFYFSAAETLRKGGMIRLFNHGEMSRDFTYIEDITEGILRVMRGAPAKKNPDASPQGAGDAEGSGVPYALYNIGSGRPTGLKNFVSILIEELIRAGALPADFDPESHIGYAPMQPGDVPVTYADTSALLVDYGFAPEWTLRDGLRAFAQWYAQWICR